MVDFFSSVFNNYKSKITNPFFGTLITVWIIRNWSIVYAFFMFDKDCTMQNKIDYINEYFGQKNFWCELAINLGLTFILLIFTYALLAAARSITDMYYKICEPWIITKIDKKAILTEADKVSLEKRVELLMNKNTSLRNDLTSSEDSNRYVSEQLTETREELEIKKLDFEEKFKAREDEQKIYNELKNVFDPVINEFNNSVKEVFYNDFPLNNNLKIKSRLLDNLDVRNILISKGYVVMNKTNAEYTFLGNSFIKFYEENLFSPF